MRDYLKGHVGACAPRQPQWQHWGELAFVGQGAEPAAHETGTEATGVEDASCDDVHGWVRVQTGVARDVECMVAVTEVVVVVVNGGAVRGDGRR